MALKPEDIQSYLSSHNLAMTPEGIQAGLAQYNAANPNAQYSLGDLGNAYGMDRAQSANWMNAGKPQTFEGLFGKDAFVGRPDAHGFVVLDKPTDENMNAYNQQFMVNGQDMRQAWEGQSAVKMDEGSGFPQFMANGQPSAARSYIDLPGGDENGRPRRYLDETLDDNRAWTYDARNGEYVSPDGKRVSIAGLGYNDPITASFEVGRLASKEGKNMDPWSSYAITGGSVKDPKHYQAWLKSQLPEIQKYEADQGFLGDVMDAALDFGPQIVMAMATMGASIPMTAAAAEAAVAAGTMTAAEAAAAVQAAAAGTATSGGLSSLLPSSIGDVGTSLAKNAVGQLATTGTIDPTKSIVGLLPGGSGITNQITEAIGGSLPDIGLGDLGQVGDVLNDAAGSVIKGGVTNLLSGRDPFANVGTNALTGTVNSATGNYLPSTGDQTTDQIIQNAIRAGTNSAIRGGNPTNAITNTVANSAFDRGVNAVKTGGLNMLNKANGGRIRHYDAGSDGVPVGDDNVSYDDFGSNMDDNVSYDDFGSNMDDNVSYDDFGSNMDDSFYDGGNGGSYNVYGEWMPDGPTMADAKTQGDAEMDAFNADPANADAYDKWLKELEDKYGVTAAGYGVPGGITPTPTAVGQSSKVTGGAGGKSTLDKILDMINPKNAAAAALLTNSLMGGTKPFTQSATATRAPSLLDQPLRAPRQLSVAAPYAGDITKYGQPGQGGEHQFFNPVKAACGGHMAGGGGLGNILAHYVQGGSSGQADDVPAMLSHGEYVIDADTVSSLGDGNNAAGAKALDQFIQKVRAQKRSAPISKIPPKAKPVQHYMKKGK